MTTDFITLSHTTASTDRAIADSAEAQLYVEAAAADLRVHWLLTRYALPIPVAVLIAEPAFSSGRQA